jgi:hypothetical protein
MDRQSYRFVLQCLGMSSLLLVIAGIALAFLKSDPGQLVPLLVPILTLLGGFMVTPPK